jgi:hypothetical protein
MNHDAKKVESRLSILVPRAISQDKNIKNKKYSDSTAIWDL